MPNMVVAHVCFHLRDDPNNEFRELLLYQTDRDDFVVWEVRGQLGSPDPVPINCRKQLGRGAEQRMRNLLRLELKRLTEEGFTITDSSPDVVE
jgi:hypothetical protein